ncbi:hypothetical protein VTK73DRAFT_3498 [Phialemonium thermophilum]|uniref:Uncharacterized protein n=1 Tax=Phialemonium thermophilum TaxID=223376 RepID=A0ABR3VHU3_9PEZI
MASNTSRGMETEKERRAREKIGRYDANTYRRRRGALTTVDKCQRPIRSTAVDKCQRPIVRYRWEEHVSAVSTRPSSSREQIEVNPGKHTSVPYICIYSQRGVICRTQLLYLVVSPASHVSCDREMQGRKRPLWPGHDVNRDVN